MVRNMGVDMNALNSFEMVDIPCIHVIKERAILVTKLHSFW